MKQLKWYQRWYVWLIISILFLVVVQVLFRIPAPNKWLDAVWEAGDLISFVGTIVLGFIAVKQTAEANRIAKLATNTSNKLIELQQKEYIPVISVTGFVGLTKHQYYDIDDKHISKIGIGELRTKENEVEIGYMLSVYEDGFTTQKSAFCRSYEMHIKYTGKFIVKDIILESVIFEGNEFYRKYNVNASLESSLCNEEEMRLFMFLISNEDFTDATTNAYCYLTAHKLSCIVKMIGMDGKEYKERMVVIKHLVKEKEAKFSEENVEMPLSAYYDVEEVQKVHGTEI